MIQKVFGVRDVKAAAFLQPFFSPSTGSALRAFGDAAADKQTPIAKHPEDYIMYEIGEYDDASGLLTAVNPVRMLAAASDFVKADRVDVGMSLLNEVQKETV